MRARWRDAARAEAEILYGGFVTSWDGRPESAESTFSEQKTVIFLSKKLNHDHALARRYFSHGQQGLLARARDAFLRLRARYRRAKTRPDESGSGRSATAGMGGGPATAGTGGAATAGSTGSAGATATAGAGGSTSGGGSGNGGSAGWRATAVAQAAAVAQVPPRTSSCRATKSKSASGKKSRRPKWWLRSAGRRRMMATA